MNARPRTRATRTAIAGLLALGVPGCGGGMPLLHGARTLPKGDVTAYSGFSTQVATGDLSAGLANARRIAETTVDPAVSKDPKFAEGALVAAAVAPGIAPVVGARVGIADDYEAGLAYTGRAARLDVRRQFGDGDVRLSVGLAGTAAFYGRLQGGTLPGVELESMRGFGGDVPIVLGWESAASIFRAWAGVRGGYERVSIGLVRSEPKTTTLGTVPASLTGDRFWGGGLVGVAAGFRRVHVAMELDVAYHSVSGNYAGTSASVGGLTVAPAAAVLVHF
ncbi:MAG: hypothetical protein U0169_25015 [Polyangiaceae bacterium]